MDKLKELKKLKELLDSGVLNETEYQSMKSDLIDYGQQIKQEEKHDGLGVEKVNKSSKLEEGNLQLRFKGQWFIIDCKTKVYIDNELIATESTKKGFDIKIPLRNNHLTLKVVLAGIKSTVFKIEDIEPFTNYSLNLQYDETWGKYSNKFEILEDD